MRGKWADYNFRENVKVTERYEKLVVYWYYDRAMEEERYAVVLEGMIFLNTRDYPDDEIQRIAYVYEDLRGSMCM